MVSEIDKVYIAGFFDGEGNINLRWYQGMQYNRHGNYRFVSHRILDIQITNTNLEVLNYIQSLFGGSVHPRKMPANYKPCYRWRIGGCHNAVPFLQNIQPYVKVKKAQVNLALRFSGTLDQAEAETIISDIRSFNRPGAIRVAQLHLT